MRYHSLPLLFITTTALSIPRRPSTCSSPECQSPLSPTDNLFLNPSLSTQTPDLSIPHWSTTGLVSPATEAEAAALRTGLSIPSSSLSQSLPLHTGTYSLSFNHTIQCTSMVDWTVEEANCTFTLTASDREIYSTVLPARQQDEREEWDAVEVGYTAQGEGDVRFEWRVEHSAARGNAEVGGVWRVDGMKLTREEDEV